MHTYTGRLTLITIPLGVLKANPPKFTPPLPLRRQQAIKNLGFGCLNKVTLFYSSAWWPLDPPGFLLMPDPEKPGNLSGPKKDAGKARSSYVVNLWNQSKIPGLVFYLGGDLADELEECPDEDIKAWADGVVEQYIQPQSCFVAEDPVEVVITRWRSDPYAMGSYTFTPSSDWKGPPSKSSAASFSQRGGNPVDYIDLSRPLWDRWFFAGEHTEVDCFATVHGAWISGVREAEKIHTVLMSLDDT